MKMRSPDGQAWRVRRRWLPWRPRLRDPGTYPDPIGMDLGSDLVVAIVLFVVLLVVLPLVFVALISGVELLLLLLLLPIALLGRIAFGRQWTVEVRRGRRLHHEELAGDWRHSGLRIRTIAGEIVRGELPPTT